MSSNTDNEASKQAQVELNVIPGEAFVRIAFNEVTSSTEFSCGIFPSGVSEEPDFDEDEDVDPDMMLSLCVAGISHFLQYDSDALMRAGMSYISKGHEVFDIIVDEEDLKYYEDLTEEQIQLMRMEPQGEA